MKCWGRINEAPKGKSTFISLVRFQQQAKISKEGKLIYNWQCDRENVKVFFLVNIWYKPLTKCLFLLIISVVRWRRLLNPTGTHNVLYINSIYSIKGEHLMHDRKTCKKDRRNEIATFFLLASCISRERSGIKISLINHLDYFIYKYIVASWL